MMLAKVLQLQISLSSSKTGKREQEGREGQREGNERENSSERQRREALKKR